MKRLFSKKGSKGDDTSPKKDDVAPATGNGAGAADAQANIEEENVMAKVDDSPTSTKGDAGVGMYKMLLEERKLKAELKAASGGSGGDMSASLGTSPTSKQKFTPGTVEAVEAVKSAQSQKVRQKRLMKELRDVKRSTAVKDGIFDVELVEDNLFEWDVWLKGFDKESDLAKDLAALKKNTGVGDVWLRFSFPQNFPFDPPFVRVLAPLVAGGYVLSGGAICMELLTPDGWSSAYSVEAVVMQTMATMIKGNARVVHRTARQYGEAEARRSYDYLVKTHKKYGWSTPPKDDG